MKQGKQHACGDHRFDQHIQLLFFLQPAAVCRRGTVKYDEHPVYVRRLVASALRRTESSKVSQSQGQPPAKAGKKVTPIRSHDLPEERRDVVVNATATLFDGTTYFRLRWKLTGAMRSPA
ncbi:hypothetical protein [Paraburkholderia nemoris]|uniref:hypothetical protein n=1 Tax=Paraburkholderia nemoris TaxID=2793076 RepID=UPI001B8D5F84|nr:hypothetical protein [Paraburkholderia nemoris]